MSFTIQFLSKIILPSGNKRDLEEIKGMHALEITLVDNVEEVISLALIDQDQVPADQSYRLTNNSSSIEMTGINSYELLVGPLLRSSL